MKFDQIAYYAHDSYGETLIKTQLGLLMADWVQDEVTGRVRVQSHPSAALIGGTSKGKLQFCYKYGTEIEILTYLDGPHWHQTNADFMCGRVGFLSHIGAHLEDGEPWPEMGSAVLVQEMWTDTHTNPYLLEQKRKYHYRIYDTRPVLGSYTKFIRRIDHVS